MVNAIGPILALDLARLTGFAIGRPGEIPRSGTEVLSKPHAGLGVQAGRLISFLNREFRDSQPIMVVKEAPFSLAAFSDHRVAEKVVRSAYGLHAIVEGMAHRFDIPCHDAPEATVTKHFTGKGRHGGRANRKRAIIERCHQLGYLDRRCRDDDRADAIAVWSWAEAHLARRAPTALHFFGGAAA